MKIYATNQGRRLLQSLHTARTHSLRPAILFTLCGFISASVVTTALGAGPPASPTRATLGPTPTRASVLPASLTLPDAATQAEVSENYGKLPLSFEANQGQSDAQVKFLSRGSGYSLFLTPTETVLALSKPRANPKPSTAQGKEDKAHALNVKAPKAAETAVVRMKLLGATTKPAVVGRDLLPGRSNYLIGKDPKQWHTDVPHYAKVQYHNVYPGIDLIYYGNQRQLEYDFVVAPGKDPKAIKLSFEGADKLNIDAQGDLILHTQGGEIKHHKPLVYQDIGGERRTVAGHYVLNDQRQVGFKVANYDTSQPLIIDPALVYSTFLGGAFDEREQSIALDSAGKAYVVGAAYGNDFPTTPGAYDNLCDADGSCGQGDITITKLNAAGTGLVYSTYLGGGSNQEHPFGIAVDSAGNAYVTGSTRSSDFPTTPGAYDELCGTEGDCGASDHDFVTKLNATGNGLVYSTFLGDFGAQDQVGYGIAVDSSGNAYVAGTQINNPGGCCTSGAYVITLNAAGNGLVYNVDLGLGEAGTARAIALDSARNAYVTGSDTGTVYVDKLNSLGQPVNFKSLGGGSGYGIAVDSSNNIYVTGFTSDPDFPTTAGALDRTCGTNGTCNVVGDTFVAKLDAALTGLLYSTYLGGGSQEYGVDIAVDSNGNASITGTTQSTDFPTTAGAFDRKCGTDGTCNGSFDAYVARLNATGSALLYSTYLGAKGSDLGSGIALSNTGSAYVTGKTNSPGFPTTAGAYDRSCGTDGTCNGGYDTFITKLAGPGTLQFSAATYSVNEGAGTVTITVTRSAFNTGAVSVNYATSNGTAVAPADYTARSGTLTFASGATTKTFTVPITNNTAAEPNETVKLTLSTATNGAFLGTPKTATLTIVDND